MHGGCLSTPLGLLFVVLVSSLCMFCRSHSPALICFIRGVLAYVQHLPCIIHVHCGALNAGPYGYGAERISRTHSLSHTQTRRTRTHPPALDVCTNNLAMYPSYYVLGQRLTYIAPSRYSRCHRTDGWRIYKVLYIFCDSNISSSKLNRTGSF